MLHFETMKRSKKEISWVVSKMSWELLCAIYYFKKLTITRKTMKLPFLFFSVCNLRFWMLRGDRALFNLWIKTIYNCLHAHIICDIACQWISTLDFLSSLTGICCFRSLKMKGKLDASETEIHVVFSNRSWWLPKDCIKLVKLGTKLKNNHASMMHTY